MAIAKSAPGVNLSFLSVMVVEDNSFIRLLMTSVLRSLGIENIAIASSGGEAIKMIEDKAKTVPDGVPPFDIIFADILMPEVNGFMLLRWIRSSPASPDKFMPVAFVSAAADLGYIAQARDLGMTEFIAKPFSTQGMWERLMGIIYKPRRFVLSPSYFGPDRRRLKKPATAERRLRKNEDIEVVRVTTKKISKENTDVFYFEFSNRLAAKVGGLAQGAEMPKIDPSVLQRVESKISDMAGDYSTWVADEIHKLSETLYKLREEGADVRKLMGQLNAGAHEMRGQGGIFGYPLITDFCKSLFQLTNRKATTITDNEFELLKAHVDAIKVVIAERVEGDGGETGRALLSGLQAAIKKYG